MSETLIFIVIAYMVFELYEVSWQRSDSMMGMLIRMQVYYKKSPLLFFLMHPTYYFIIYLLLMYNEPSLLLLALFIKTIDIVAKILLIQQVFEKRKLSHEMSLMLLTPLHPLMPFIGLLIYPPFIIFALYM